MGIYIASKAVHGPRWRELRGLGLDIVSSWIDESEPGATADWADLWDRCVREAGSAEALICYHEEGEVLKGALVEVGAALGAGVPVHVVSVGGAASLPHSFTRHRGVTSHASLDAALAAVGRDPGHPRCQGFEKLRTDVAIFTRIADMMPDPADPSTHHGEERARFRIGFLEEEYGETLDAWQRRNFPKFVDGLVDMAYVAVGTAVEFLVPLASRIRKVRDEALKAMTVDARPGWSSDPEADAAMERIGLIVGYVNSLTTASPDGREHLGKAISVLLDEIMVISVLHRIPFEAIWDAVQKANVSKADPATGKFIKRVDGKVIKPEGWTPPDAEIEAILRSRGWHEERH